MIKGISEGLSEYVTIPTVSKDRGKELEDVLTNICYELGKVGKLTNNSADVVFVLGAVGSYLISKNKGTLPKDNKPPSYIFNDVLFPAIDNLDKVVVEEIPDDGE